MHRKFLITMTAIVSSFSMAAAPAVTALANDDVSTTTVFDEAGKSTTAGSITVEGGADAVMASHSDATLTINGDITTSGLDERSSGDKDYEKPGAGVYATDGSTVIVNGDITTKSGGEAVNAEGEGTTVTVTGDINTAGKYKYISTDSYESTSYGVVADSGDVTVTGDITVKDGGKGVQVYGTGADVTVNGNISVSGKSEGISGGTLHEYGGTGVSASSGKTIVNGDIKATDGGKAVSAHGKDAVVIVNGSTDSSGVTEYKGTDGNTYQSGSSSVSVSSGATVTVNGNVVGGSDGASFYDESTLNIAGSVTATGVDTTAYSWNDETKKYDIPHTSVSGTGMYGDGDATVTVGGNINAVRTGINLNPDNDDKKGIIIVEGMINTSDGRGYGITISRPEASHNGIDFESKEDILDDIPDLVVGGFNTYAPISAGGYVANEDGTSSYVSVTMDVFNAINYIINVDEESKNKYEVNVSGDNIKKYGELDTVNINEAFSVAAKLPDGITISGGDNVKVVKNEDGTFTLTLTNYRGGIYVKATAIVVPKEDDYEVIPISTNTTPEPEPTPTSTDEAPAGAIVVTPAVTPAAASDGTAPSTPSSPISGEKVARSVSVDLGKVTPVQYKNAVIENVAAAPQGGALNLETDRVSFFDRKMIETFATRSDIDINVVFTFNGRKIKVTIPAGYNLASLLDENGYCGYLRLLALLGGTDLKTN